MDFSFKQPISQTVTETLEINRNFSLTLIQKYLIFDAVKTAA
jgi:hypothetical protein